jgi:hypothetical protein
VKAYWNLILTIPSKVYMSGKLMLSIEETDYRSWFSVEMKSGNSWAQPSQGATLMPNNASSLYHQSLCYIDGNLRSSSEIIA